MEFSSSPLVSGAFSVCCVSGKMTCEREIGRSVRGIKAPFEAAVRRVPHPSYHETEPPSLPPPFCSATSPTLLHVPLNQ